MITRTLCGTCDTELVEHSFTQERTTLWPPNQQLAGWSEEAPDAEPDDDPPNQQGAGLGLPFPPVPALAGWGAPPLVQPTVADRPSDPQASCAPGAGSPLLDDVASLPGVRAGVIAPDDPYFAYLRAIARPDGPGGAPTDSPP